MDRIPFVNHVVASARLAFEIFEDRALGTISEMDEREPSII